MLPAGSKIPGLINLDLTPYSREILRELSPQSLTEEIVLVKPTQFGGTTISDIASQAIIDLYPMPYLMLFGSDKMAKKHVVTRVEKAFEKNPRLVGKVKSAYDRKSGTNRNLKMFTGGYGAYEGGRTPDNYRHDSYMYIFIDDADAFTRDVGGTANSIGEGSPVELAKSRMDAQQGKGKFYISGTTTDEETSIIWAEYLKTDQRKYNVPCPKCLKKQVLLWENLKFERNEKGNVVGDAWYECSACGFHMLEHHKPEMLMAGEWIPTTESSDPAIKGYWINALYTRLGVTWTKIAKEWVAANKAKKKGDITKLVRFFNHRLAEPYRQNQGEKVESSALFKRREDYTQVPEDVGILAAGIDVQDNRVEISVYGYAEADRYFIEHEILGGDPTIKYGLPNSVFNKLEKYLNKTFKTDLGNVLPIMQSCLDTGYLQEECLYFMNHRKIRGRRYKITGIKGSSTANKPIISKPNEQGVVLIGTDTAKEDIFYRLKNNKKGEGMIHFNKGASEKFLAQVTAEEVRFKYKNGVKIRYWWKQDGARNEGGDCMVYSLAACKMVNPNVKKIIENRTLPKNIKKKPLKSKKNFATDW